MKNYNRITTEIKDTENILRDERIELALCLIGYIRQVLNTELIVDGTPKTVRGFLNDLPSKLTDVLDLLPGSKVKILLNNLDTVGLASLMNDDRLSEVVKELRASSSDNAVAPDAPSFFTGDN